MVENTKEPDGKPVRESQPSWSLMAGQIGGTGLLYMAAPVTVDNGLAGWLLLTEIWRLCGNVAPGLI